MKADSCFRCTAPEAQEADSFSDICSLEETRLSIPCQLTGAGDKTIHTITGRFADSPAIHHVPLFSCDKIRYLSISKVGLPYSLYRNEQITAYIHKTDGKKQTA